MFFSPFSSDPVKLYFSVPVELYTVFSDAKHPGQKPRQQSGQKSGQKSGRIRNELSSNLVKNLGPGTN